MTKLEFLNAVASGIKHLPPDDITRSIDFYSEMIDDRIEDGMSEQAAVAAMGPINEAVSQILLDTPLPKLMKANLKKRKKPSAGTVILIVLGAPLWISVAVAVAAAIISVFAGILSVIISLFAASAAVGLSGAGCILGCAFIFAAQGSAAGVLTVGTGLILAGLSILMFIGSHFAAKGFLYAVRGVFRAFKTLFIGKETAQ